jgi:hypothetical protein
MDDPAEHGHDASPEAETADTVEEIAPVEDAEPVDPAPADTADDPSGSSHPAVDEVLRSLERLEDVPVDEHVEAFERAHDELRRALSEARDSGD